jgi:hypothetical protein
MKQMAVSCRQICKHYLNPNLDTFSCIGIIDESPINTEIPGMTLLFVEYGISQSMVLHCISKLIFDTLLWA